MALHGMSKYVSGRAEASVPGAGARRAAGDVRVRRKEAAQWQRRGAWTAASDLRSPAPSLLDPLSPCLHFMMKVVESLLQRDPFSTR